MTLLFWVMSPGVTVFRAPFLCVPSQLRWPERGWRRSNGNQMRASRLGGNLVFVWCKPSVNAELPHRNRGIVSGLNTFVNERAVAKALADSGAYVLAKQLRHSAAAREPLPCVSEPRNRLRDRHASDTRWARGRSSKTAAPVSLPRTELLSCPPACRPCQGRKRPFASPSNDDEASHFFQVVLAPSKQGSPRHPGGGPQTAARSSNSVRALTSRCCIQRKWELSANWPSPMAGRIP